MSQHSNASANPSPTTQAYANELLRDAWLDNDGENGQFHPYRMAYCDAIELRGHDKRTLRFKHYDRIIKWMAANWSTELDV